MAASRGLRVAGWIVSILVAAFLIVTSVMGKFGEWEGKEKMFDQLGYSVDLMKKIGGVEIGVAILYLIPQTSFLGAILLTGYLGGATATHVRIGDQFFMPIVIGVLVWIGLGMRKPEVFQLLGDPRPAPPRE